MIPRQPKRIFDWTHGYHYLTDQDLAVISHPIFQRLRRINQLSAQAVFPSANHKRFEHSLGVMRLGVRALDNLFLADAFYADHLTAAEQEHIRTTARYAFLLHDIGHTPLSHVCEPFLDRDALLADLKNSSALGIRFKQDLDTFPGAPAAGELMTCVLFLEYILPYIRGTRAAATPLPSGIRFRHLNMPDLDPDLFCRMVLGLNMGPRRADRVCTDLLNHPAHDVDKLDYVWRDSRFTNPNLVAIDVERLTDGFAVTDYTLGMSAGSLGALMNLIAGRDSMYIWVYNHHTVCYIDEVIQRYVQYLIDVDNNLRGVDKKNMLVIPRRCSIPPNDHLNFPEASITSCYFSKLAIYDGVDDSDIFALLKANRYLDNITRSYAAQIFDRQHLDCLYKTPMAYNEFIDHIGTSGDRVFSHSRRRQGIPGEKPHIEDRIKGEYDLEDYDLMVIDRSIKLYNPGFSNKIWIVSSGDPVRLTDLLSSNDMSPMSGLFPRLAQSESGRFFIPFICFNLDKISPAILRDFCKEYH
jgi:uncharacterized protein